MTEESTESPEGGENAGHPLAERLSRPTTVLTVGVVAFTLLGFVAGFLINDLIGNGRARPAGEFGFSQRFDGPGAGPNGPGGGAMGPGIGKRSDSGKAPMVGEVKSVDGSTVTLKTPDGQTVKVNLKSGTGIAILR